MKMLIRPVRIVVAVVLLVACYFLATRGYANLGVVMAYLSGAGVVTHMWWTRGDLKAKLSEDDD